PFFRQNLISNPIRYDLEISTRLLNAGEGVGFFGDQKQRGDFYSVKEFNRSFTTARFSTFLNQPRSENAAAVSGGKNPMVAFFSIVIVPLSGETSPRRSANKVDLPAPLGPTNPIRSPRLTWSDTSSKSARPANDFESCETVSIAESAQCSLVQRPAQLVNHE